MRAAGAGIGAFFTPTGVGTPLAEGKETREIDGRDYVLEYPIKGDVALIRRAPRRPDGQPGLPQDRPQLRPGDGHRGRHRRSPQVRRVVEIGELDPEAVVTPGIYVDRIVVGADAVSGRDEHAERAPSSTRPRPATKDELAAAGRRATSPPGSYVNLGIGQPTTGRRPPDPRAPASCCTPRTACSTWARPPSATRSTPT